MKKILLFSLSLFCIIACDAQVIQKGDKLFGGSFSFSVYDTNPDGVNYYNSGNVGILPTVSFAVKNDLTLGIRGSFTYSKVTNGHNGIEKNVTRRIGSAISLFLKKYKLLQNKFGVYFDNSVNGSLTSQKSNLEGDQKYWGMGYSFTPGVFCKFSDKFFGEANIGSLNAIYSYSNNLQNSFGVGASFLQYFNLGINYLISKKPKT